MIGEDSMMRSEFNIKCSKANNITTNIVESPLQPKTKKNLIVKEQTTPQNLTTKVPFAIIISAMS